MRGAEFFTSARLFIAAGHAACGIYVSDCTFVDDSEESLTVNISIKFNALACRRTTSHPPTIKLKTVIKIYFSLCYPINSVPIKDDMDDDYTRAMQGDDQDCVGIYSERCPMSILAFLLRSKN